MLCPTVLASETALGPTFAVCHSVLVKYPTDSEPVTVYFYNAQKTEHVDMEVGNEIVARFRNRYGMFDDPQWPHRFFNTPMGDVSNV